MKERACRLCGQIMMLVDIRDDGVWAVNDQLGEVRLGTRPMAGMAGCLVKDAGYVVRKLENGEGVILGAGVA